LQHLPDTSRRSTGGSLNTPSGRIATKHAEQVARHWQNYRERADRNVQAGRTEPALQAFRWLLEELRVSLFAQELKTPYPVSFKRVERSWADLTR
jgi:ATP-dependent helicase HrpA